MLFTWPSRGLLGPDCMLWCILNLSLNAKTLPFRVSLQKVRGCSIGRDQYLESHLYCKKQYYLVREMVRTIAYVLYVCDLAALCRHPGKAGT